MTNDIMRLVCMYADARIMATNGRITSSEVAESYAALLAEVERVSDALQAVTAERDALALDAERLRQALEKISAIRDDIINTQKLNWSGHVYPLVAALDEAGIGCEPNAAMKGKS